MNVSFFNHLWYLSSRHAAREFQRATQDVSGTQKRLLQNCLIHNRDTVYVSEQPDLPLSTYDDYLPYIERIADGEQNVLTAEPVKMFELSSGSTAASKMIPYTRTLQSEFGRGLSVWITDLFRHHPTLRSGPAYWSISPLTQGRRQTRTGIPIGFEEDSAYLGPLGPWMESILAVPNLVKHISDINVFRYVTLLFLLRCENLRLISVWNPTFLTLLLALLSHWWESLLRDISDGTLTPPAPPDPHIYQAVLRQLPPNRQRVQALSQIKPHDFARIWPHLALISCWADGASAVYAQELQSLFPHVSIQPKGLLATEAFVSFPLTRGNGNVLAVTSHYFEFLGDNEEIYLAHQLEKNKMYSVVVTTGGGFYRYQLNDIVEVTGFYHQAPRLKFIGKRDQVSDYFGEKLSEPFVAQVLERLFEKHQLTPIFAMLAPEEKSNFHYVLYLEFLKYPTTERLDYLTIELDSALRENFHYDYCRRLGQLGEVCIRQVKDGAEIYTQACHARGQRLGDIKPTVLQKTTGWEDWFAKEPLKEAVNGLS